MTSRTAVTLLSSLLLLQLAGCAGGPRRPLLYHSIYAEPVSTAQVDQDIDDCMALARQAGVRENRDGEAGRKAATGAMLGGVAAGAWGLVRGDGGERLAAGAVAGGATGAVKGAIDSTEQNPVFRRYVERCLGDLGHEVIGWQ